MAGEIPYGTGVTQWYPTYQPPRGAVQIQPGRYDVRQYPSFGGAYGLPPAVGEMGPGFGFPPSRMTGYPTQPMGYSGGYTASNPLFFDTSLEARIPEATFDLQKSINERLDSIQAAVYAPPAPTGLPMADRPATVPLPPQPPVPVAPAVPNEQIQQLSRQIEELNRTITRLNTDLTTAQARIRELESRRPDGTATVPAPPVQPQVPVSVTPPAPQAPTPVAPPPPAPVSPPAPPPPPAAAPQPTLTPGLNHRKIASDLVSQWNSKWWHHEKADVLCRAMLQCNNVADRIEVANRAGLDNLVTSVNHGDCNSGTQDNNVQHLLLNAVYRDSPVQQARVTKMFIDPTQIPPGESWNVWQKYKPTNVAIRQMVEAMTPEQRQVFVTTYGRDNLITHLQSMENLWNKEGWSERGICTENCNKVRELLGL